MKFFYGIWQPVQSFVYITRIICKLHLIHNKYVTPKTKHMKRTFFSIVAATVLLLVASHFMGCDTRQNDQNKTTEDLISSDFFSNSEKSTYEGNEEYDRNASESPAGTSQQSEAKTKDDYTSAASDTPSDLKTVDNIPEDKVDSKIIKSAEISMQVKEYKSSRAEILALIKSSGAYVASENQSNTSYSYNDDMEIRLKPAGFDDLIEKLLEISIYIDYSKITADDVTEEYVDAEARLKAKEDVETQYKEILKKAYTISEIIAIQEKINKIREDIEAYKAKLKFMDDKVSYSTIKLHFYEKLDEMPAPSTGFFYKLGKAFKSGWNGLQVLFIGIIYLWPLWVIAFLVFYFIMWQIKRRKRKRALKNQ